MDRKTFDNLCTEIGLSVTTVKDTRVKCLTHYVVKSENQTLIFEYFRGVTSIHLLRNEIIQTFNN